MRRALAALLITLGACAPAPSPTSPPQTSLPPATIAPTPATRTPPFNTPNPPTASLTTFTFDVVNHASIGVVVSVASDTAATMPGFEPGQSGTVSISLRNPENGIGIEIQGSECRLLASAKLPTPGSFTLLVEDGPQAGSIKLLTLAGASSTPIPLPSNSLVGCGG